MLRTKIQITALSNARTERDSSELFEATFERLLQGTSELDSSSAKADFRPLVEVIRQDRLLVIPFSPEARNVTNSLGLDGAIAPIGAHDYLAVSHLNGGPNKLDAYLDRSIEYAVRINPDTGALDATVKIALTNEAPNDLPLYAEGNSFGYPRGTNRVTVVVHTPHELVGWTGGDEPELARSYREFDRWRYEHVVVVPRGETRTIELALVGSTDLIDGYELDIGHQPLIRTDHMRVSAAPYIEESFALTQDRTLTSAS